MRKDIFLVFMDLAALAAGFFTFTVIFHNYGSDAYKAAFGGSLPLIWLSGAVWLILAYTTELYAPNPQLSQKELKKGFIISSAFWLAIMIGIGYKLFFQTPGKTALTFIGTLGLVLSVRLLWHEIGEKIFFKKKIIFLGSSAALESSAHYLANHPEADFELVANLAGGPADELYPRLNLIIQKEKIYALAIADDLKKEVSDFILAGHRVIPASDLYETIFEKIAVEEISPNWLLQNAVSKKTVIGFFRELVTRFLALIFFIILLPLIGLIAFAIVVTSPGPAFINQVRVGLLGQTFILHKFRSMRADAERAGPQWAAEDDARITSLGRILRATHLDELPQLWNIAMGDLAFIGPRPERPELIGAIKKSVPLFDLRLLTKPGITGWAQINYHYGRSIDDAREKLAYDLYYIKNKSLRLDVKIILRTLKHFIA